MDFFPEIEIQKDQAEAIARGLYAVAKADGAVHEREAANIAEFFGSTTESASDLNALAGEANDQHTHKIASLILSDSEQRLRHTDGIYMPDNTVEQLGLLEEAFRVVKRAEGIDKEVRAAKAKGRALYDAALEKNVITADEHAVLLRSEELRNAAIQVDDFSQEEYLSHSARGVPGEAVADVA